MDISKDKSFPKISIIIPVYNGSNYLAEAINSALNQTYRNIEVIVVNDGSNDNGKTREIALFYGNRVRYYEKENGGISTALNLGISVMTGEYFSWLSHDDKYLPSKISEQINFLLSNNRFIICYSDYTIIDEIGLEIRKIECPYYSRIDAIKTLIGSGYINGCTILIHKKCFESVGLFNSELLYSQDIEMWIRVLSQFEIGKINKTLVCERHHFQQNSVTKNIAMNNEVIQMYINVFESLNLFKLLNSETSKSQNENINIALGYDWLGDKIANFRSGFLVADNLYKKSLNSWNSVKNPSWLKYYIGSKNILKLSRLRTRLINKIYSYLNNYK